MENAPKDDCQPLRERLEEFSNSLQDLTDLSNQLLFYIKKKFTPGFISNPKSCFLAVQPRSLNPSLRLLQHQMIGLNWLISLYQSRRNGILADDMGLGKTIQSIAFLAFMIDNRNIKGPHLVILPKTTMLNFKRECELWLPVLKTIILPGQFQERSRALRKYVKTGQYDILIATYQSVMSCLKQLSRVTWSVLIIDQAHKIKNANSQRFKALQYIEADFTLLMTGTPIGVDISQLWSLLNFIHPQTFRDSSLFSQPKLLLELVEPQEKQKLQKQFSLKYQRILQPYMLRRTKKQVAKQLPPKIQKAIYLGLSKYQIDLYKQYLESNTIAGKYYHNEQIQLRKLCCHPYVFKNIRPKVLSSKELLASSGKMMILDKLLNKLFKQKRKILIFSQFLQMISILQQYCRSKNLKFCTIKGSTSLQDRDNFVKDFSFNDISVFILSTRAGNLGINLVSADTVIIYDSDWNPQVDLQAMDRAYRIGQKKQVHIYRLVTENTIQQRIHQVQKQRLLMDINIVQKGRLFREMEDNNLTVQAFYNTLTFKTRNYSDQNIEDLIKRGESMQKLLDQKVKHMVDNAEKDQQNLNQFQLLIMDESLQFKKIQFRDADEKQRKKKESRRSKLQDLQDRKKQKQTKRQKQDKRQSIRDTDDEGEQRAKKARESRREKQRKKQDQQQKYKGMTVEQMIEAMKKQSADPTVQKAKKRKKKRRSSSNPKISPPKERLKKQDSETQGQDDQMLVEDQEQQMRKASKNAKKTSLKNYLIRNNSLS